METSKNGWKIGCYVVLAALAAVSVVEMVGILGLIDMNKMSYFMQYGTDQSMGEMLQQLFSARFFFVVAALAFAVGVLLIRNRRELFARIFVWAMLLLALFASYQFVANAFILPLVTASEGFSFAQSSLPILLVAAVLVALIAQWDDKEKKAVNRIALVVTGVNAVFCIIRFVNDMPRATTNYTAMYLSMEIVITVIVPLAVFFLTKQRRVFNTVVYGMTEDEAAVVEEMEDKLEAQKERYEEEAIEKIEQQIEEELRGALEEKAEDLVAEDAAGLEEEIAEQLAELEEGAGALQDVQVEVETVEVEVTEETDAKQDGEDR